MTNRETWDEYFINIAKAISTRATCPRLSVGAVIVKNNRILSTGYNGSPSGHGHCIDDGCVIENNHCIRVIHAEINALLQLSKHAIGGCDGSTIYITHYPCLNCFKCICQSGISRIVYNKSYGELPDYESRLLIPHDMMPDIIKV